MTPTKSQQAQEYAEKKTAAAFDYVSPNIDTAENLKIPVFTGEQIKQAYTDGYTDGYTAAEQSLWRSVEDELPHPDTICLVIGYKDMDFNGRFVRYTAMAWYDGEDFYDAYNDRKYHPVKWMAIPLPDTNTEKK